MKTYDIFISYRRLGGFESANLIAEKFRRMGYSVFFDVESLRSGKFNEQLYKVIEQCKDFVVVLPPKALDRCTNKDESANEDDWIRKEVLYAMERQKNIIPVMLAGFGWPEKMPIGMEALKDYQAITATNHDTFDFAMQRLASYCKSKPHRFKWLKKLTFTMTVLVTLSAIGYFILLQIARPICTSVANEYTIAMGIVNELRVNEDELKTEWDGFLSSYHSATTQNRRTNLENDMLAYLNNKILEAEALRSQIRPTVQLSDWQTVLLGLRNSQKEDVQAIPMFVESYVDDIDSLVNTLKRVVTAHAYKPSETRTAKQHFQFYEHSVNMMYYSYLQEITKFPEECHKTHNELSRSWTLLPTISKVLPQEEYENLMEIEGGKMKELLNKMESYNTLRENETYEIEQQLDSLETMAEALEKDLGIGNTAQKRQYIAEEHVSIKQKLVEQKKNELTEETQKLLQVYEELKESCKLNASDSEEYQWGKVIRMATMLSQSVKDNKTALTHGIQTGSIIKPSVVYTDLCTVLDDYLAFHPTSKSYLTSLRQYYKIVAEGKLPLGGLLVFAFKNDAKHPIYEVGDIIVKRNDQIITDDTSLAAAVSISKQGTVEFLRKEGSEFVLHKENVPETTILVGYMEVGEY